MGKCLGRKDQKSDKIIKMTTEIKPDDKPQDTWTVGYVLTDEAVALYQRN